MFSCLSSAAIVRKGPDEIARALSSPCFLRALRGVGKARGEAEGEVMATLVHSELQSSESSSPRWIGD